MNRVKTNQIWTNQIWIGNIRKCTKCDEHITFSGETYIGNQCISGDSSGGTYIENELYKENAILIEITKGGYVDLDRLKTISDYFHMIKDITAKGYHLGGFIMPTMPWKEGELFVENNKKNKLRPYYQEEEKPKRMSLGKLKRKVYAQRNCRDIVN